jgi:hypothetical protein
MTDCLNQLQNPKRDLPIALNPVAKILAEFRMENCFSVAGKPFFRLTTLGQA